MATLTVSRPTAASAGTTPPTQALTGTDSFPGRGSDKYLIVVTGATAGTITVTVDDPNSTGPANAKAFNPDVDLTVGQAVRRVFLLTGAGRFVDDAGNINLATSGTPAGSNIEIYAV